MELLILVKNKGIRPDYILIILYVGQRILMTGLLLRSAPNIQKQMTGLLMILPITCAWVAAERLLTEQDKLILITMVLMCMEMRQTQTSKEWQSKWSL